MMSSVKLSLYFTRHNQSNTKGPFVDINGSWHSFLKPSRIHSTHGSPAGLGSLAGHIFWYHVKLYQPLHCSRLLYIQIYIYIWYHTCFCTCPFPRSQTPDMPLYMSTSRAKEMRRLWLWTWDNDGACLWELRWSAATFVDVGSLPI